MIKADGKPGPTGDTWEGLAQLKTLHSVVFKPAGRRFLLNRAKDGKPSHEWEAVEFALKELFGL